MQGYDAGVLMGKQTAKNYQVYNCFLIDCKKFLIILVQNLFYGLFGNNKIEPALQELTEQFLDWQWDEYLSKDAPQEYMDELSGVQDGGLSIGVADVGKMCSR